MFAEDPESKKFLNDAEGQEFVNNTHKLSEYDPKTAVKEFDALFYPGGHGPTIDLWQDKHSLALITAFYEANKVTAAVCHGPVVFSDAKLSDGSYLLKGRKATVFTNEEEEAVQLTKAIPFLCETRMVERGGLFEKSAKPFDAHVVVDKSPEGRILITGQNPASAGPVGEAIIKELAL